MNYFVTLQQFIDKTISRSSINNKQQYMNQSNEQSVFHVRSSRAVVTAGYRLYMSNFRRLLRSSWIAAIFYALCMGLFGSFYVIQMPKIIVTFFTQMPANENYIAQMASTGIVLILLSLLFIIATIFLLSYGYAACREHMETGVIGMPLRWYGKLNKCMLLRTAQCMLWLLLLMTIIYAIVGGLAFLIKSYLSPITAVVAMFCLLIIYFVALLPLSFTFTKYLLTPKCRFLSLVAPSYNTGMRHLGSIFIVTLVVAIFTSILTLVALLPANILYIANLQSQMGTLQGDPAGMPENLSTLNFVVFALMGFIQGYVYLSTIFPYYFLFGSIEKQEEERRELSTAKIRE